jgi:hypothetical protein
MQHLTRPNRTTGSTPANPFEGKRLAEQPERYFDPRIARILGALAETV